MVEEGLFEKFPCDAIFALHNMPGFPVGKFGFKAGPFMASSDTVLVTVSGRGGHGSAPHLSADPVVAAAHIIVALQTIVSRNVDPRDMAVVSVGAIHGGDAPNVIPDEVKLRLTVRAYRPETRAHAARAHHAAGAVAGHHAGRDGRGGLPLALPRAGQRRGQHDLRPAGRARLARAKTACWASSNRSPAARTSPSCCEHCPGSYLIVGNGEGEEP